jgi:hypothetical protein
MSDHFKHLVDATAVVTTIATVAGWLPNIAAVLTIIWTAIRIVESKTFQRLLGRRDE